jgi:hypothetical protein
MTKRDGAVDAVLAAETLIEQFSRLGPALRSPARADQSAAIQQAQHLYPEIWAQLDAARAHLRSSGVELATYDELRARQPAALMGVAVNVKARDPMVEAALWTTAILGVPFLAQAALETAAIVHQGATDKTATANRGGIQDARDAAGVLRKAMPHVQWQQLRLENERAAAALAHSLGASRARQLVIGFALVAALIAVVFGVYKLMGKPADPHAPKAAVDTVPLLRDKLAKEPCNAPAAELLVKKLRMRGEVGEATRFGKDFLVRCGDNAYIKSRVEQTAAARTP